MTSPARTVSVRNESNLAVTRVSAARRAETSGADRQATGVTQTRRNGGDLSVRLIDEFDQVFARHSGVASTLDEVLDHRVEFEAIDVDRVRNSRSAPDT